MVALRHTTPNARPLLTAIAVAGIWLLLSTAAAHASVKFEDTSANNNMQVAQQSAKTDLVKLGRKTSRRKGCASCHSFDGKRKPGPTWKGLYGSNRRLTNGKEVVADDAYLRRAILEPRAEVVKGFPAKLMPINLRKKLSDKQLDAIIHFINTLN